MPSILADICIIVNVPKNSAEGDKKAATVSTVVDSFEVKSSPKKISNANTPKAFEFTLGNKEKGSTGDKRKMSVSDNEVS